MDSPLLICGMHRSGTSLAGRALRLAGVNLGRRINGFDPKNPDDDFEDREIRQFHEEMLAAAGTTSYSVDEDFVPPAGRDVSRRAWALVSARLGPRTWGWRDPRTSLFLDLWQPLVPEAAVVILYRHPIDVALSLLRHGTDPALRSDPLASIRAWVVHNRRLLDYIDRHRARCFVTQATAIADDVEGFVKRLAHRFKLPLRPIRGDSFLLPGDLATSAPDRERPPWERVIPEALDLYRELDEAADSLPRAIAPETRSAKTKGDSVPDDLRLSESLLYDLLEAHGLRRQQRSAAEAFAAALDEERKQLAETREQLERQQSREAELAATMNAIERSRGFRLVAGWWRLAGRIKRR